jgi:Domain of unknown function (DUF4776)
LQTVSFASERSESRQVVRLNWEVSDEKCLEMIFCSLKPDLARGRFVNVMRRKARGKYSHDFGNTYPPHRSCSKIEQGAGDASVVPKYIGWRWDEPINGMGDKKWFPGHINKTVRCLMKCFLKQFPKDILPVTRRDQHGRIAKTCNDFSQLPQFDPSLTQKPLLHIQKNEGEYCITMKPLKDSKTLETALNPYLNCSPLKFVVKKHPEEIKKHRAKKMMREHGFTKKCSCLSLEHCRCKSQTEKKLLAYELEKVSEKMNLEKKLLFVDLEGSSDSEIDVEFTTPSAMIDGRKLKPDVVHCETQYNSKDLSHKREQMKLQVQKDIIVGGVKRAGGLKPVMKSQKSSKSGIILVCKRRWSKAAQFPPSQKLQPKVKKLQQLTRIKSSQKPALEAAQARLARRIKIASRSRLQRFVEKILLNPFLQSWLKFLVEKGPKFTAFLRCWAFPELVTLLLLVLLISLEATRKTKSKSFSV